MKSDLIEIKVTARQLQKARRFVADFFAQSGCEKNLVGDMKIATGEALANAVEHSGNGKANIRVSCKLETSKMTVEIQDDGIFKHRMEGINGGRGYGMQIMKSLMDEVEIHHSQAGTKVTMVKVCKELKTEKRGHHEPPFISA